MSAQDPFEALPPSPVLLQVWRGQHVESQHRGAWVVSDASGRVLDSAGDTEWPFYARSAIKSVQALPLLETGAADRFGFDPSELALALSSHNGEPRHTSTAEALLERIGLQPGHLLCGPQRPDDPRTRAALVRDGHEPGALHNNCSGKHTGFLALGQHLGEDPARYLEPGSQVQRLVRQALSELTDLAAESLSFAVDGCSAPTYRLPLRRLATAFARVANPEGLEGARRRACRRMTDAVAAHPLMLAGSHRRLCSELAQVSGGRLFPKVGAEALYAVGEVGGGRGFAIKLEDGGMRAFYPLVVGLLRRLGFLRDEEYAALAHWIETPLRNWAGLEVGRFRLAP